jgi:hypothetical protein
MICPCTVYLPFKLKYKKRNVLKLLFPAVHPVVAFDAGKQVALIRIAFSRQMHSAEQNVESNRPC